jgi:hypothetical protein
VYRWIGHSQPTGANLQGIHLEEAQLRGAKLQGADLSFAYLNGADLKDANLRKAKLGGADLRKAYLVGVDLNEADLTEANLKEAIVTDEQLNKTVSFKGAIKPDGSIHPKYDAPPCQMPLKEARNMNEWAKQWESNYAATSHLCWLLGLSVRELASFLVETREMRVQSRQFLLNFFSGDTVLATWHICSKNWSFSKNGYAK